MKKLLLLLSTFLLSSCSIKPTYSRCFYTSPGEFINGEYILPLNTLSTLTMYEEEKIYSIQDNFNNIVSNLSKQIDRYHDYQNFNNIKTINDSCGSDSFVEVSEELFNLVKLSIDITKLSEGKFNLFIGELVDLYSSFLKKESSNPPEQEEINNVISYIPTYLEIDNIIELNESNHSVKLNKYKDHLIKISLGGIGKGYVVDKLYQELDKMNEGMIISCGSSSMALLNSNPMNQYGQFTLGFKDVSINYAEGQYYTSTGIINAINVIGDYFISTSGDDEQFRIYDDSLYTHILDASTGVNNKTFRSISLLSSISNNAILDALSTACFNCASIDEAISLINNFETAYNFNIDYLLTTPVSGLEKYNIYVSKFIDDNKIYSYSSNAISINVIEED